MFLLNEKFLVQDERKNSIELIFVLKLAEILIKFNARLAKLTRNKQKILTKLTSMFKLIDIQVVISRKIINNVFDNFYKKSKRFIKFLIKKL